MKAKLKLMRIIILIMSGLLLASSTYIGMMVLSSENTPQQKTMVELTFVTNAEFEIDDLLVEKNTKVNHIETPVRDGYSFLGWYLDQELTNRFDKEKKIITENLTLYGSWQKNRYYVFFETNGGSAISAYQMNAGETLSSVPFTTTKDGYNFAGWYVDPDLQVPLSTISIDKDTTLYASWSLSDVYVTFDSQGGSNVDTLIVPVDEVIPQLPTPTRDGYIFKGWYENNEITQLFLNDFTASRSYHLLSQWERIAVQVNFNSNGGVTLPSQSVFYGEKLGQLEQTTKSGFIFKGWFLNPELTQAVSKDYVVTSDITLYASYEQIRHTVSFYSHADYSISDQFVFDGQKITQMPSVTRNGYVFKGWFRDSNLTQSFDTNSEITANLILYAKWDKQIYTLNYNTNISNYTIPSRNLTYLSEIVVNPVTYLGYEFLGWYLDSNYQTPFINGQLIQSNTTLYARWNRISYEVTFEMNGSSPINPLKVFYGEPITVAQVPVRVGYEFKGFFFDEHFQSALDNNFVVYGDTKLYAKWEKSSYNLIYQHMDLDSQITSVDVLFENPIPTDIIGFITGYTFIGWYEGDVLFTETNMPARDVILTAKYEINVYSISFDTQGGTPIPTPEMITHGQIFKKDEPLSKKTGYYLEGWYLDLSDVSTKFDFSIEHIITDDILLYARWIPNERQIIYLDETTYYGDELYDYLEEIVLPIPTKEGHTFIGWYENDVLFQLVTMPDRNIRLVAKWQINIYEISFYNLAISNISYAYNASILPFETPTRNGFTFVGWYLDKNLTTPFNIQKMPATDVVVYAKWQVSENTIGFETDGGTYVEAITGNVGDPVTAPENPEKEGYVFMGWYSDQAFTNVYHFTTIPASGITVYAKWEGILYEIEFVHYTLESIDNRYLYFNEEISALPEPYKQGYVLTGWYMDSAFTMPFILTEMPSRNLTLYAKWEITYYRVAFDTTYRIPTIVAAFNEVIHEPEEPIREGYRFIGWYEDAQLTKPFVFQNMPDRNLYLYAKWEANEYEIRFESNDGTPIEPINVAYQSTIHLQSPSRIGYAFVGWFLDENLSVPFTQSSMPANDLVIYAKWQVNQYQVTFVDVDMIQMMFDYGKAINYAPTDRNGYTFMGWFTDKEGLIEAPSSMPDEALILYSKFEINTYTITYNSNGGTTFEPYVGIYDSLLVLPTPNKEGNSFMGWYTDSSLTKPFNQNKVPANHTTLYAKWQTNTYRISFTTGTIAVQDQLYQFGQSISNLPIINRTGYTFIGWFMDSDYNDLFNYSQMPATDIRVYAKFDINLYTITFNSNGGTEYESITEAYETPLNLPLPVREGYRFDGWFSNASLTTPFVGNFMPGNHVTIYAKWSINTYRMSFQTETNQVMDRYYTYDQSIDALPILERVGYTFIGWYLDQTHTTAFDLTNMPSRDVRIYARWQINSYTVTFNSNGGSPVESITRVFDSLLEEPMKPVREGYTFRGWFIDEVFSEGYNFVKIGASDITLYAKWDINTYIISFRTNIGVLIQDQIYQHNELMGELPVLSEYGSLFMGWYTSDNVQIVADKDNPYQVTNNLTLTAKWEKGNYTISFEENGGSEVIDIEAPYNDAILNPNNPTKVNYQFGGWYLDEALTQSYLITRMPGEDLILYAKWIRVADLVLTYHPQNNEDESIVILPVDLIGSEINYLEVTRTGYTFKGWYLDETFNQVAPLILGDQDLDLYAKWEANLYTITFDLDGGEGLEEITQAFDKILKVPSVPTKRGYLFNGWYTDETYQTSYTFGEMPSENITIYASWELITYYLTYENLFDTTHQNPETYNVHTETIELRDPSDRFGYRFVGWFDALTGGNQVDTIEVGSIGNHRYYARFEAYIYTITYQNLYDVGQNNPTTFNIETPNINLIEPSPREGYQFVGWFDSLTGGNEVIEITQGSTENKVVYARWIPNKYSIGYHNLFGSMHSNTLSYTIETPTIELQNPMDLVGYSFVGWFDQAEGGSRITSIPTGSFGEKDIFARWNQIPVLQYMTPNTHYYLLENQNVTLRIQAVDDDLEAVILRVQVGSQTFMIELMPNEGDAIYTSLSGVTATYDEISGAWLVTITSQAIKDNFMNQMVEVTYTIDDQFGHNISEVTRSYQFDVNISPIVESVTSSGSISVSEDNEFIFEIEIKDNDLSMIRLDTNHLGRINAFADVNPYGSIANQNRLNSQGIYITYSSNTLTGISKLTVTFNADLTYYLSTMDTFVITCTVEDLIGNEVITTSYYQLIYN